METFNQFKISVACKMDMLDRDVMDTNLFTACVKLKIHIEVYTKECFKYILEMTQDKIIQETAVLTNF